MKRCECEFEAAALEVALQSRWPDRVDEELRAHIGGCPVCSDVVALAGAFEEAREETRAVANVPPSGHVWQVAQLRARRDAAKAAAAPITVAQMVAFGCAFGVAGACFGATSTWFQGVLGQAVSALSGENARALLALAEDHAVFVGGLAAAVVAVPTAVYLTLLTD